MNNTLKCRIKPYIQPFERWLALAELSSVSQSVPEPIDQEKDNPLLFKVSTSVSHNILVERLAYWEAIGAEKNSLTTQVLRERTVYAIRNGIDTKEIPAVLLRQDETSLPNRRCLRYGTHGIHEYRGKFFPQLVRSLINVGKVPTGGIVLDPMVGSGTTAVESILGGYRGIGLDMNPLSLLMARTKCALLSVKPEELETAYNYIHGQLTQPIDCRVADLTYFSTLPSEDQKYLKDWFSEQVLLDLDQISKVISMVSQPAISDFMRLALSNIIRSVSWQKDEDLRVRKQILLDAEIDPIREFLEELGRSVRLILAFLHQEKEQPTGQHDIREGDARNIVETFAEYKGKVDVIITSPPYATALPYLDTDRLSLCYLNLLPRPEHRNRDQFMIGNREISEKRRQQYWKLFQDYKPELPQSVVTLIESIDNLNSTIEVGFRRRNLPALLAKYFIDMKDVFVGMKTILKDKCPAYVVIGNNHTIAGGIHVDIDTASLLVDIAESVGFDFEDRVSMEMLLSRDIFKKNACASEEILCFRKPN